MALLQMTQHTVLVIDDNDVNKDIALFLLEKAGYTTLSASNAEEGLAIAFADTGALQKPDLILMDLHLPGKDGFGATRELKANPKTRAIPVIAYTALSSPIDSENALNAGCEGIISKPINIHTFACDIVSYLNKTEAQSTSAHSSHPANTIVNSLSYPLQNSHAITSLLHDVKNHLAGEATVLTVLLSEAAEMGPLKEEQATFLSELLEANQSLSKTIAQWREENLLPAAYSL